MKKVIFIIIGIIVIVGISLYFVNKNIQKTSNTTATVTKPTVVASFYPLYYFASQIAGDKMNVINIGRGNDPHEFKPSTKDVVTMRNAKIVLLQGAGLESWGEDLEWQLKKENVPVFVATEHLELFKFDEHADEHEYEVTEEHIDSHDSEDVHEEEDHHHNHGAYDPHTWLDPVLAKETVLQIAKEFRIIDPQNKEFYQKNAQILADKLDKVDEDYKNAFADGKCTVGEALISHNAFGYIGRRYGLDMHSIAGISTLDKPSAKLLAQLKDEVQSGVLAILTEENSVKKYAKTIARETGITMIPVNALATGVIKNNGDYFDGMYSNLESFKKAYGCKD